MESYSLPATLSPPLDDRSAITDALYRCILGLDTNDSKLFDSAFALDASFSINGRVSQGLPAIHTDCFDLISKLDTTHFVTNIRINIEGDKATLTASALAQHFPGSKGMAPDQSRLLTGSLYWAELVKDGADGLWKIEAVNMKSKWVEGDWAVLAGN
ncbi:hypothetical protein N7495_006502 [Penicillium taxi]|uniref:uncharacterized protein n=1 Tax=Penicillium taxi TaxID=168475 RepID=UPI0025451B96|nr:uncharacterized protein N7495_006502 [Penicillium taxi]KAJ5894811.1 hypothetical protein N7495_006502 [Penicillium taxi]